MLRFHHYGPVLLALAAAGCQKSAQQEQSEAINAQRAANQTASEAANERSKEVAEANREAAKEIAEAQRVAGKDTAEAQSEAVKETAEAHREANDTARKAMADEVDKTSDAQRKANAETREAIDATRKAQVDLRQSVETKLNKLDERMRELTKEASDPKVAPAVASNARQKLTLAETEIKSLRMDLPQLQNSPSSVEQFRARADKRVAQIERTLDQVDDQL
jgi:chromosome segregation ATPase